MSHLLAGLILLAGIGENSFAAESYLQSPDINRPVNPKNAPILWEARNRMSCKQVSSCAEAVEIWCNGYDRADGDNDGIPCENVCSTIEQVNEIRAAIGCQ